MVLNCTVLVRFRALKLFASLIVRTSPVIFQNALFDVCGITMRNDKNNEQESGNEGSFQFTTFEIIHGERKNHVFLLKNGTAVSAVSFLFAASTFNSSALSFFSCMEKKKLQIKTPKSLADQMTFVIATQLEKSTFSISMHLWHVIPS